ncbi:hypothetical protein [Shewanella sp. KT0246]|uniref:hypothetical protein n=1 Tax=Shewanella sp. KT0246 TaxID=2815912 RepID=UPI001BBD683D|nr:hypothetical protein [Shewanella sp. KT0246]GIU02654.1 hypothetical protein TUM4249_39710 [Shewanella sp. KT0246]
MNQQTIQNLFDDSVKKIHQDQNLSFSVSSPSVNQFNELRKDAGWGEMAVALAQFSLINSIFHIGIYSDVALLAYGRVIGDGALFFIFKI